MYYAIGWPKRVNLALPGESATIKHICFDAVKILLAAIGTDFLGIWYAQPLIPIVYNRRSDQSLMKYGSNRLIVWKPDSRKLVILTTGGVLILYHIEFNNDSSGIFLQVDPPTLSLKRDSAELFIKENIPKISLREMCTIQWEFAVTAVCCISLSELLVANNKCELLRIQWTDLPEFECNDSHTTDENALIIINLRIIQFYISQQCNLKRMPAIAPNAFVACLEYSPFIGGCAAVFSDNRAAFLIANHLRFETANMHGFWISDVEDATVCSVNHKFRLLAFGRHNSDVLVYGIEDATGGVEYSHRLSLNETILSCTLGSVSELKWSPDGFVIAVSWSNGGIALWSTFGALLMSSFNWDFGIHVDIVSNNPLCVNKLEWSTEGYQLFMTCSAKEAKCMQSTNEEYSNVLQLIFVKSTLAMNPCMTSRSHVLLQGDDTIYLNQGDNIEKTYFGKKFTFPNNQTPPEEANTNLNSKDTLLLTDDCLEVKKSNIDISSILAESKCWTVLKLPQTYASTNWPIRYSAIDADGVHLAVAGRTGLAHYSILTKKWKLFGNESQEKDFVVSGGLLWWKAFIVTGCYSLLDHTDEIRCYPQECKLDNQFGNRIQVRAPVISLNMFQNQLIVLTANGIVSLFDMLVCDAYTLKAECAYEVDVKSICVHPACIVSLTVANLRSDFTSKNDSNDSSSSFSSFGATFSSTANANTNSTVSTAETIIVNVCGRILMIHRDNTNTMLNSLMASCLASCVECFWLSNSISLKNSPMRDCLWLFSGAHGMRVWLPIMPPISRNNENMRDGPHRLHTFMSKRIMLSFPLKLYPLVILFDNVIVLGVENETTLYTNDPKSHFALPFSQLERKSQIYLHKILRQLIKRNLGYNAWEIAQSCRHLPYFPHSLELLLHEVLEEEATSKEPIPDALLPSVLDFIREFPVYLQTIVQCARKTEIALWPHLFSIAGKPKNLFQQCLEKEELLTAASYLIILQNLEPSIVSKQYATLLLEVALSHHHWELSRDLIRFLKAIDPNEIDSPRSSMVVNVKIAPQSHQAHQANQVNQNADAFDLVLGPIGRERSFSTSVGLTAHKTDKKEKAIVQQTQPSTSSLTSTQLINLGNETTTVTTHNAQYSSLVVRRKSERNAALLSNRSERRETFCIEAILQRHARQLLQSYQLLNLGYMSAHLDFHLVTWLSLESDKAAVLDDYVLAIESLHRELILPKPITTTLPLHSDNSNELDDNHDNINYISNNGDDNKQTNGMYDQLQHKYYSIDPKIPSTLPLRASSQTSESGYFSLALMDTTNHIGTVNNKEQATFDYNDIQMMRGSSIYNDNNGQQCSYSLPNSSNHNNNIDNIELPRILSDKLAIKMRYLLQLFIEANCTDFAIILSILLQDAASIGRIINVATRSEPLTFCERICQSLKHVTHWSFEQNCVYREFMILLQPQIYRLDEYITQTKKKMTNSNKSNALRLINNNINNNSNNSNNCNNNTENSFKDDLLKLNNNKCKQKNSNNNHKSNTNDKLNNNSNNWSLDNYIEHIEKSSTINKCNETLSNNEIHRGRVALITTRSASSSSLLDQHHLNNHNNSNNNNKNNNSSNCHVM